MEGNGPGESDEPPSFHLSRRPISLKWVLDNFNQFQPLPRDNYLGWYSRNDLRGCCYCNCMHLKERRKNVCKVCMYVCKLWTDGLTASLPSASGAYRGSRDMLPGIPFWAGLMSRMRTPFLRILPLELFELVLVLVSLLGGAGNVGRMWWCCNGGIRRG